MQEEENARSEYAKRLNILIKIPTTEFRGV